MKILVTGATGFAGTHLVNLLKSQSSDKIFGTSLNSVKKQDNVEIEQINLLDSKAVAEFVGKTEPDRIYHLAALASPFLSFSTPNETIINNVSAQLNILEAVRKQNLKDCKILIISSAEVYGNVSENNLPIDEETPLAPLSPYAVSKITQDFLAYQYFATYAQNIIRVRPFNHIGPGQSTVFSIPAFAKQIAEIEKGKQEPVLKVGNLSAKRDFSDVRDMVKAYVLALEKGENGQVYNLGSDQSFLMSDILEMLLSMAKVKIEVLKDESLVKKQDAKELRSDSSKFRALTGWKNEIPLQKTLEDTLNYFRHQTSN